MEVHVRGLGRRWSGRAGEARRAARAGRRRGRWRVERESGTSHWREHPVDKGIGDKVFAGTINESGVLEFKTTGGKDQTTLAKIIKTVQEAQGSRAPTQRFVDSFARVYTPIVCVAAVLVAVVPWLAFGQPFYPWLYKALVLLVIACPCALVISTPVTVVSGLTAAARRGILIKGGVHLENGRKLKVIALDKTGTITEGKPRVTDVQPVGGASKDEVLRMAASLDALSQHPVALAVVAAWSGERADVEAFKSLTGRGVEGKINGEMCFVGNHRLAEERKVCSLEVEAVLGHFEVQGKSTVVVASSSRVLGIIAVADTPRETSVDAVRTLHGLGIKTLMLSGDNQATASAIARGVGIDNARGGMLPEDKLAEIEGLLKTHGDAVGMVGDGVNDAPALARATVGSRWARPVQIPRSETADAGAHAGRPSWPPGVHHALAPHRRHPDPEHHAGGRDQGGLLRAGIGGNRHHVDGRDRGCGSEPAGGGQRTETRPGSGGCSVAPPVMVRKRRPRACGAVHVITVDHVGIMIGFHCGHQYLHDGTRVSPAPPTAAADTPARPRSIRMDTRKLSVGFVSLALLASAGAWAFAQPGQPPQPAGQAQPKGEEKEGDEEEVITLDKAPEAVRAAAIKLAGDAKNITKVIKEEDDEDVVQYEVEYNEGAVKCAAIFSIGGRSDGDREGHDRGQTAGGGHGRAEEGLPQGHLRQPVRRHQDVLRGRDRHRRQEARGQGRCLGQHRGRVQGRRRRQGRQARGEEGREGRDRPRQRTERALPPPIAPPGD